MEHRYRSSKLPHSLITPTKRKRSDLEMIDERETEAPITVNYPLLLFNGELIAERSVRNNKTRCIANDSTRLQIDVNEVKSETQLSESVLTNQKIYGLSRCTNFMSENTQEGGKKNQEPNVRQNVDDNQLNNLSGQMVLCRNLQTGHSMKWPVSLTGKSKVFVPLKYGENTISLENDQNKLAGCEMKIIYKPLENRRFVRPVYIICTNSDGTFQAPPGEDNSVDSAKQRLSFNARLLQTFTAEHMNLHGFGRKTFRLEEDDNGNVKVNVFHSKLKLDEALCMSGGKLYDYFHEELNNSELYDPLCKFWVFMSCTRYTAPNSNELINWKDIPQYVKGHTALGGGNMALFGTGCLHTWARNLDELVSRFTDDRKIDTKAYFDDSARRGYYWANYSTTLGAAMHELGHTFNLPHTPSGIMGRGFDDMNVFFVGSNEPGHNSINTAGSVTDIYRDHGAHWHRSSAAILSCSRWIGERIDDKTPCEAFAPLLYNSADKRGPVGSGCDGSGKSLSFSFDKWLREENLYLKGFRIRAKKYINALQIIGTKKETPNDGTNDSADGVSSQWFGNQEADGETYEFHLDNEREQLISIDVRAGSWLDAVRFHSSHKSTKWIGGKGGDLYNLSFGDCNGFDNIFGTAGEEHVTSIGITRTGKSLQENKDEKCYFYSHHGIRVVEVRQENGEVMKHWEFLDGEPQQDLSISMDDLFLDKADTIAVYDGNGECALYNIESFKRTLESKS